MTIVNRAGNNRFESIRYGESKTNGVRFGRRGHVVRSDPVTRLKLSMGPGARIAYTRAMSEHRCFPKKRLSTHTMYFKWHHRNLS